MDPFLQLPYFYTLLTKHRLDHFCSIETLQLKLFSHKRLQELLCPMPNFNRVWTKYITAWHIGAAMVKLNHLPVP